MLAVSSEHVHTPLQDACIFFPYDLSKFRRVSISFVLAVSAALTLGSTRQCTLLR